jgi:hypothetical protein
MIHRAPQELFDLFAGSSELLKMKARVRVIAWMRTLDLRPGDKIVSPDPVTGLEEELEFVLRSH